jgi:signal transduction histidine kinase
MVKGSEAARPDYQAAFRAAPALLLLLDRDFHVVDASEAFLEATRNDRFGTLGRSIFEIYPEQPGEDGGEGPLRLLQSLERVLHLARCDRMAFQRLDLPRSPAEGGGFEERYWSPCNAPVPGPDGRVEHILHRVEDVTEFVLARQQGRRWERVRESMQVRGEGMEAEIFLKAQRLAEDNHRLRERVSRQAGALAHDFNDILSAIHGYADLAAGQSLDDQVRHCVEEIKAAADRAAAAVRRIHGLAGPAPLPVTGIRAISTEPRPG